MTYLRRSPPHPVIVTVRDDKDYVRVLFYSYSTTITGGGSSQGIPFLLVGLLGSCDITTKLKKVCTFSQGLLNSLVGALGWVCDLEPMGSAVSLRPPFLTIHGGPKDHRKGNWNVVCSIWHMVYSEYRRWYVVYSICFISTRSYKPLLLEFTFVLGA